MSYSRMDFGPILHLAVIGAVAIVFALAVIVVGVAWWLVRHLAWVN